MRGLWKKHMNNSIYMNENVYSSCVQKASRYERLPKSSTEALQHYPGSLNVMLPRSIRVTIFHTERKNAASFAINFLERTQGSKTQESGRLCAENLNKAGPLRSSPDGSKTSSQNYSQATRPFTNGSTVMNANGSQNLCDHIADDYHAVILTGTDNFMFPREYQSKNGHNQFLQDETLAIGRPTPWLQEKVCKRYK